MTDGGELIVGCQVGPVGHEGKCSATNSLRTRIIAAIAKADQDWCSDNPLYEDMADAVIRELGLPPTWGKPSFDNGSRNE